MYQVDDTPKTIHLYVVREEEKQPSVMLPMLAALFCIGAIIGVTYYSALHPVYTHKTLTVPAIVLPPQEFIASVPVIPTGVKTYPATYAHGVLTITNGSIISQTLPASFKFLTNRGVEIVTDSSVFVPPGDASGYGYAAVNAHAGNPGKNGNISALAINQVIGSSVYIRNLSAFSGGKDIYSVTVITAQDRSVATAKARDALLTLSIGLHYPCSEAVSVSKVVVSISWRCQMLTYHIPAFYHVTGVRISGKNLLISVWFAPRPIRYWAK